jgi:hypothetical protein
VTPPIAAAKQDAPPAAKPIRGSVRAMIQPIAGPPTGVVPWKATCQSAITRPRMLGSELSWIGRWALFALWLWAGWHLFIRRWLFLLRA